MKQRSEFHQTASLAGQLKKLQDQRDRAAAKLKELDAKREEFGKHPLFPKAIKMLQDAEKGK